MVFLALSSTLYRLNKSRQRKKSRKNKPAYNLFTTPYKSSRWYDIPHSPLSLHIPSRQVCLYIARGSTIYASEKDDLLTILSVPAALLTWAYCGGWTGDLGFVKTCK